MLKYPLSKLLYLIVITLTLSLSGILLGYDTSIIYGAYTVLGDDFSLSPIQGNILVSLVLVGTVLGALIMGYFTDKIGRKKPLLFAGLLFLFSTVCISIADTLGQLLFFCLILSLAIGGVSFAVPNYIAEIAPPNLRGRLVSVFQLFITIGVLFTFITNHYLFTTHISWRIMFAPGAALAVIFIIGVLIFPESPRWLALMGRDDETMAALKKLRGNNYHVELAELKSAVINRPPNNTLLSKENLTVILLAIVINLISAISGISAVVYYAPQIFIPTGRDVHPLHLMEVISLVNFFATLGGVFLVDIIGRRRLMLLGSVFMTIALIILAIHKSNFGFFADIHVIAVFTYIVAFACSSGLLSWLIISEIFLGGVRGKGAALGVSTNWLANLLVIWLFPLMITYLNQNIVFAIFAVISFLAFIFYFKYLPETRNLALEVVEQKFQKEDE